jgi:D-glycero-D-manno-heptose 1,7-bisphosphate phosphatase
MTMKAAIFLDRDGVLIEDTDLLTDVRAMRLLPGVPEALQRLKAAGFLLLTVSNQTVVARGMLTEQEVAALNTELEQQLARVGGARFDGHYFCPHHPRATLPAYRRICDCRKPRPGLLLRAARAHDLDLRASFMVGDRLTDIHAGARAGCRTILVLCGRHAAPPIETVDTLDPAVQPDHTCADLSHAADWIIEQTKKLKMRTTEGACPSL